MKKATVKIVIPILVFSLIAAGLFFINQFSKKEKAGIEKKLHYFASLQKELFFHKKNAAEKDLVRLHKKYTDAQHQWEVTFQEFKNLNKTIQHRETFFLFAVYFFLKACSALKEKMLRRSE